MEVKQKLSIKKHSRDVLKVKSIPIHTATNHDIICQLSNFVNNWEIFSKHNFFMMSSWCKLNLAFSGILWTLSERLNDELHNDQHYRNYGR